MEISLQQIDVFAIAPLLFIIALALSFLLIESVNQPLSNKISIPLAIVGLLVAICLSIVSPASQHSLLTNWIAFDSLSRIFTLLFLSTGLMIVLISPPFFKTFSSPQGEYFFLLFSALFGLMLIGSSADFLTLFLGIETLSLSLYVLCGYVKKWDYAKESALKYFLLGALATAILLYGIAFVYGAIGTTQLNALSQYHTLSSAPEKLLFMIGISLITLGLAFEGAIVPFQMWAPDVYAGASTPVTAFMAVGTKIGAFAAFIRVFLVSLPQFNPTWNEVIALLAYVTLIYANIVALQQTQIRRFFAYSGIAHAGFLLIPFAAQTSESLSAVLFYLSIYSISTLGAFSIFSSLERTNEGILLNDLKGLFWSSPLQATVLSLCLLTLAGIPPLAGFFAKFYVFKVAYEREYYGLVIVGLLTTILSAFFYMRIVAIMLSEKELEENPLQSSWSTSLVGAVASLALVGFSCFPNTLLNLLLLE